MKDDFIKKAEEHPKGWGRELWIANSHLYCGKILDVKKRKKCSIHYHKIKDETFYISKGKIQLDFYPDYPKNYPDSRKRLVMSRGDIIHIPKGLPHQFLGLEDSEIIEVSTQHFDEDSNRIEKGD